MHVVSLVILAVVGFGLLFLVNRLESRFVERIANNFDNLENNSLNAKSGEKNNRNHEQSTTTTAPTTIGTVPGTKSTTRIKENEREQQVMEILMPNVKPVLEDQYCSTTLVIPDHIISQNLYIHYFAPKLDYDAGKFTTAASYDAVRVQRLAFKRTNCRKRMLAR